MISDFIRWEISFVGLQSSEMKERRRPFKLCVVHNDSTLWNYFTRFEGLWFETGDVFLCYLLHYNKKQTSDTKTNIREKIRRRTRRRKEEEREKGTEKGIWDDDQYNGSSYFILNDCIWLYQIPFDLHKNPNPIPTLSCRIMLKCVDPANY